MKKIYKAQILSNDEIAKDIWRLEIKCPTKIQGAFPGRFINIYLDRQDLLLPRPISICKVNGRILTLVYGVVGKGTKVLSSYEKDGQITISDPLGNGYDLQDAKEGQRALLIGGGIGIPPLLELAIILTEKKCSVTVALGFRDEPFLLKDFKNTGASVYVSTDSGRAGFHGNVADLVKAERLVGDIYFACGPKALLSSLSEHCKMTGKDIQVSMEERMGCGYGACVGCVCKIFKDGGHEYIVHKKICTDGPVFWGSEVSWNE